MKNTKSVVSIIFPALTFLSSAAVLLIGFAILLTLFGESRQAISEFGFFHFLLSSEWNYVENIFGGFQALLGTLITSVFALLIAVPFALGIAVFITEICPQFLKGTIAMAIELLAAIPSIIYGMWGLFTFAPLLENTLQLWVSSTLGKLPLIGGVFSAQFAGGVNITTASLVLSIMIVPFIASIARDTFLQTPSILKESAYAIGATRLEVIKDVIFPFCKKGVLSGIIIAAGRALGETMAIAYVIGNRHIELTSVFDPYTTITATLANEFNEASGVHMSSLFLLALILFISNMLLLALSKLYIKRASA